VVRGQHDLERSVLDAFGVGDFTARQAQDHVGKRCAGTIYLCRRLTNVASNSLPSFIESLPSTFNLSGP
jgi:hypothetical protein